MRLEWRLRELPLSPLAAFAHGHARDALERVVAELPLLQQARLQRIEHEQGLLLIGVEADLPWAEGVRYLGSAAGAPQLLMPTLLQPGVPLDLLERACARTAQGTRWLLLDEPALLWGLL